MSTDKQSSTAKDYTVIILLLFKIIATLIGMLMISNLLMYSCNIKMINIIIISITKLLDADWLRGVQ